MEQILYPFKNALWALRPCKAFGRSISASLPKPQTHSPWEGAILLGLPPLVPVGGFAPKQGCFGCLPKVLHDAKPAEQAILDIPFLNKQEVFRQSDTLTSEYLILSPKSTISGIFVAIFAFQEEKHTVWEEAIDYHRVFCIIML